MMKSLIKKEFIITAHPMTYVMTCFGAMTIIPNYPYTLAFFYVCLGIFFDFINARENSDFYYMAVLPVSKHDIVKAKTIFITIFELVSIVIAIPFAILSIKINPNGDNMAGIDPNVAFFGIGFIIFAIFNAVFIPYFFKSAYKVGKSFIFAIIPVSIFMMIVEISAHIPVIASYIDATAPDIMLKQIPVLLLGIVIYAASYFYTIKAASKNFEKVDL